MSGALNSAEAVGRLPRHRPVRVAVAGLGQAALQIHLPACGRFEGVAVVAGCDPDEAARRAAVRAGVRDVHSELPAMLAASAPDVVLVLTPPALHEEHCLAALAAGAHV